MDQPQNYTHDHGERWDQTDTDALVGYFNQGLTYAEISDKIGRSPSSIGSRLYKLRRQGRVGNRNRW